MASSCLSDELTCVEIISTFGVSAQDNESIGPLCTNEDDGSLAYAKGQIVLEVLATMGQVKVTDCGPGLSATQQQQIWDRFARVGGIEVKSGTGVGLGLGLYICRNLIERQGGQVGVESILGQGSTFWFTLPLADEGM